MLRGVETIEGVKEHCVFWVCSMKNEVEELSIGRWDREAVLGI